MTYKEYCVERSSGKNEIDFDIKKNGYTNEVAEYDVAHDKEFVNSNDFETNFREFYGRTKVGEQVMAFIDSWTLYEYRVKHKYFPSGNDVSA